MTQSKARRERQEKARQEREDKEEYQKLLSRRNKPLNNRQRLMQQIFVKYLYPFCDLDTLLHLATTCNRHKRSVYEYIDSSRETCTKEDSCVCVDCYMKSVILQRAEKRVQKGMNMSKCNCTVCFTRDNAERMRRHEERLRNTQSAHNWRKRLT